MIRRLALPLLTGVITGLVAVACTVDDKDPVDTDEETDIVDTFTPTDTLETGDTGDTDGPDTDPRFDDTDAFGCPPDWAPDCNGTCYALVLVGNDFCDRGPAPKPNFNCSTFQFDGGDCAGGGDSGDSGGGGDSGDSGSTGPCPIPGDVRDCVGTCVAEVLLGDGQCDEAAPPGANFACDAFSFDNGDCDGTSVDSGADTDLIPLPCPSGDDVRDCRGQCYYAGWVGDGTCDDGTPSPIGSPDFACELHAFDDGDCPVPAP